MTTQKKDYDVVVVGSGLGGLTTAALLAQEGRSVLVAEQGHAPGGYAGSFKRGPYTFDPAIHIFAHGHGDRLPRALFDHLGVGEMVDFLPVGSYYKAAFPEHTIEVPFELESFIDAHVEQFPHEARAINDFFRLAAKITHEAHHLPPQLGLANMDAAAARAPTLFSHLRSTLAEVLDQYFTDPKLKAVCAAQWPYPGTTPSRLSFLTFATILMVTLEGGFYVRGSFGSFVTALVTSLERSGGRLLTDTPVTRIGVEGGHVTGVELAGEEFVRAPVVVSGADARRTFEDLVGEDEVPGTFMRRLRRMTPSLSAVVLFGATKLDLGALGATHELFAYDSYDHEQGYREIMAGRPGGTWATCPTLVDPSLAPPGEHVLTMTSLARYDLPWPELIDAFAEEMVSRFDAALPGLRDGIEIIERATPLTLERYCRNTGGAAYGWENTPTQSGGRRTPRQAPVDGLYLAGHWTQPGSASLRVIVSGIHTAQAVLLDTGSDGLSFSHPDFPPATGARVDAPPPPPVPIKRTGDDMSDNERLVRAFFDEVWNKGNFDFIDEYYAPDFVLHALWQNTALGRDGDAQGGETAKQVIGRWRAAMPDLYMTVEECFEDGDVVVMRHRSGGTQEHEFMGIAPTHKFAEITGVTMTRVIDGIITDAWTCWDAVSMMQQLGLVPGPPPFPNEAERFNAERHGAGDPEQNVQIIARLYDALWNHGDTAVATELVAADCITHAPGPPTLIGPDGLAGFVNVWRTAVPDGRLTIDAFLISDDRVATRFRFDGTHTGQLVVFEPTGKPVSMGGMAISRLLDGKVISHWCEIDRAGVFQQIGLAPPGQSDVDTSTAAASR
jgi:prolycopene isomerase